MSKNLLCRDTSPVASNPNTWAKSTKFLFI